MNAKSGCLKCYKLTSIVDTMAMPQAITIGTKVVKMDVLDAFPDLDIYFVQTTKSTIKTFTSIYIYFVDRNVHISEIMHSILNLGCHKLFKGQCTHPTSMSGLLTILVGIPYILESRLYGQTSQCQFHRPNGGGRWIVYYPILLTSHYIAIDLVNEEIKFNLNLIFHMVVFLQSSIGRDQSAMGPISNFGDILKPCIGLQCMTLLLWQRSLLQYQGIANGYVSS